MTYQDNTIKGWRKPVMIIVTGLAALVSSVGLGGCARNEAIISASYRDVQNAKKIGERKRVYTGEIEINKDLNGDGNYDVSLRGNGEILIRVDRKLFSGSEIGIKYKQDNQSFTITEIGYFSDLHDSLRKKVYPIESRGYGLRFREDGRDTGSGPAGYSYTGRDILDNKGKLKERVINYNRPEVRDLERIEDFDNKGKMTKVVIRNKNSNNEVYVIQWNEKKKKYEIVEDKLNMSFERTLPK